MPIRVHHGGRRQWPSCWTWKPRLEHWNDFDLWMVRNGSGMLETPDASYTVRTGDVFLLRPDEQYVGYADPDNPANLLYIHFDWIDSHGRIRRPDPLPALHRHVDDPRFFATLMVRCLRHIGLDDDHQRAAIWLEAALDELDRHDRSHAPGNELETRIRDLAERIVANPACQPDVASCAAVCRVSERHFARIFKSIFKQSPQGWIITQRMARAQLELRDSDQPIKRIALDLGYNDVAFFTRQFRQHCGTTPGVYRRQHQQGATSTTDVASSALKNC